MKQYGRLSLAFLVALSLLLTACTSLASKGPSPEAVTTAFLSAMRASDWQAVAQQSDKDLSKEIAEMEADDTGVQQAFLSQMTFAIGEVRQVGSQVEVDVEVALPDLDELFAELMGEAFALFMADALAGEEKDEAETEAEMLQLFEQMLRDPDAPRVISDATFLLVKEGGTWKVAGFDGLSLGSLGLFD